MSTAPVRRPAPQQPSMGADMARLTLRTIARNATALGWVAVFVAAATLTEQPLLWTSLAALALVGVIAAWAWKRWRWLALAVPVVSEAHRAAWRAGVDLPGFLPTREEASAMLALRKGWLRLTEATGLAVVAGALRDRRTGEVRRRYRHPRLRDWERVPAGLRVQVSIVPGQNPAAVVARSPELTSLTGYSVTCMVTGPDTVEMVLRMRDPLEGIRPSREPTGQLAPLVIGRTVNGDASLDLTDASHTVIQGMTRSGKSVACYGLLSQLAGVAEVRILGVDPNAVLLSPWLPHTQPGDIALGADAAAALAVIDRAVTLMDEKLQQLPSLGVEKLEVFTPEQPLCLIVLEEFPALIRAAEIADQARKPAERLLPRIRAQVGRLVSEGAKAGMRVWLITQRADASILDGPTRAQMGTRMTFAVDNADAVRMLHPAADAARVEEVRGFPPGRALLWQHRRETVVQADNTDYETYLGRLGGGPKNAD